MVKQQNIDWVSSQRMMKKSSFYLHRQRDIFAVYIHQQLFMYIKMSYYTLRPMIVSICINMHLFGSKIQLETNLIEKNYA